MTKINKIYAAGFAVILALPLLAIPPYFFPSDFGKTIIFRSILTLLILLFCWQVFYRKESFNLTILKNNRIIWALAALFATFLLATIFSVDSYFSFWGWPIRGGGFINFTGYIILAIMAFVVLKKEGWTKLWNFSIGIGVLVALIAVAQYLNLMPGILTPVIARPASTMGNPILLAIYLLLLLFLTLSFAIREKVYWKKACYLASLALFSYVILLTGSRAAYLGIFFGVIYFFLRYPALQASAAKKMRALKIVVVIFLLAATGIVIYANTTTTLPPFLQNSRIANSILPRLSIKSFLEDSRFTAAKIEIEAIKAKPLLGYGPENFSIGFDKHYNADPTLFGIVGWWDRAHNIILQTMSDAGILGLLAYLGLLITAFWKLHKLKRSGQNTLMAHTLQTILIGYFVANLFSFDSFSSYLIFFLLIGYSMHLVQGDTNLLMTRESTNKNHWVKNGVFITLLIVAMVFLWQYNLNPLQINAQINKAQALVNQRNCGQGIGIAEAILPQHSFLDSYVRLKYIELIKSCTEFYPQNASLYQKRGLELVSEAVKIQPLYTRYWIFMGTTANDLATQEKDDAKKKELISQAYQYLNTALGLAPKHQEIIAQQSRTALIANNFTTAKQYAQNCIAVNPAFGECYFYLALTKIYTQDMAGAKENLQLANKGFNIDSRPSLEQLANAYGFILDYQNLAIVYEKLIAINPATVQYHSSLAFFYSKLGRYKEAKEQALKVLELSPESKPNVDAFLRTLPL